MSSSFEHKCIVSMTFVFKILNKHVQNTEHCISLLNTDRIDKKGTFSKNFLFVLIIRPIQLNFSLILVLFLKLRLKFFMLPA